MSGASASVKNTFLEFKCEDDMGGCSCRRRARSAEVPRTARPLEAASEFLASQVLRLTTYLRSGHATASPALSPAAEPKLPQEADEGHDAEQPPDDTADAAQTEIVALSAEPSTGHLRGSISNVSVSTMAPGEDSEQLEPLDVGLESSVHHQSSQESQEADGQQSQAGKARVFKHCEVPRVANLKEEFSKAQSSQEAPPTTLMLRNIPNRYTQWELVEELGSLGFQGTFDFIYSPIDTGSMGNVGYAFINFVDSTWAEKFMQEVAGHTFRNHQQKTKIKAARVSVAHLQGLEANLRHYEKAAVNGRGRSKRCCGPLVLQCDTVAPTLAP